MKKEKSSEELDRELYEEVPVKPKKKKKRRKKKKKQSFAGFFAALILICMLAIAATVGLLYFGTSLMTSDTVMPNVYAGDIYLGGMTYDEMLTALDAAGYEQKVGGTLEVKLPLDISFSLDYKQAGACPTKEMIANAAYAIGRGGDMRYALETYMKCMSTATDVSGVKNTLNTEYIRAAVDSAAAEFAVKAAEVPYYLNEDELCLVFIKGSGNYWLDTDKIYELCVDAFANHRFSVEYTEISGEPVMPDFDGIHAEMAAEPRNASFDTETFEIYEEVVGVDFDVEAAKNAWLNAAPLERIAVPVVITKPEITSDQLRSLIFRDLLGEQTTYYWGSNDNRICNIGLAADIINGTILLPGEIFSYNDVVGERTSDRGFKPAGAYADGEVIYEVGGGICQVSSTLYAAMLRADLETVNRQCHQFVVNYLPYGIDATVSWGRPDFQFANNTDYPVKLVLSTSYDERSITVQIWGTKLTSGYCEPRSIWWQVYDKEYPTTQIGWGAGCYRDYYDAEGNLIESVWESNSYYDLHSNEINWPPEYYEDSSGGGDSGDDTVILG